MKPSLFPFMLILALLSACNLDTVPENISTVTASFTFQNDGCLAPCDVSFTSNSPNATSYEWNFGDGSALSTEANPVHTYLFGGTFDVQLVVSGPNNSTDTMVSSILIDQSSANFSFQNDGCQAPCDVAFTSDAPNALSYVWDFGDGSPTSSEANPTHTYQIGGSFEVQLIVTNPGNIQDTVTQTVDIQEAPVTFNLTLGEAGVDEVGVSIAQMPSGKYMLLYKKESNCSEKCMVLALLDKDGNVEWTQDYAYNTFDAPDPSKMRIDPVSGNLLFAGNTQIGSSNIQAYASFISVQKNVFWADDFGNANDNEYFHDVSVDANGDFYFIGYSNADNDRFILTKTNRTGDKIWEKKVTTPAAPWRAVMEPLANGGFMIFDRNFNMIEVDNNGILVNTTDVGNASANEGVGMIATSDGGWMVTGESGFDQYTDIYVVKLDASLSEEWSVTFPDNGWFEFGVDMAETSNGDFGLLARKSGGGFNAGIIQLVRLDSSGNEVFAVDLGAGNGSEIVATTDGGFIVVGDDGSGGVRVIKTDADGNF